MCRDTQSDPFRYTPMTDEQVSVFFSCIPLDAFSIAPAKDHISTTYVHKKEHAHKTHTQKHAHTNTQTRTHKHTHTHRLQVKSLTDASMLAGLSKLGSDNIETTLINTASTCTCVTKAHNTHKIRKYIHDTSARWNTRNTCHTQHNTRTNIKHTRA